MQSKVFDLIYSADSESIKIIPFEIENIKNITEFNIKDIKALISKNGYILVI